MKKHDRYSKTNSSYFDHYEYYKSIENDEKYFKENNDFKCVNA